ncbi:MAG: DUF3500 domain-containing protein [Pseudomonadota bacterium]
MALASLRPRKTVVLETQMFKFFPLCAVLLVGLGFASPGQAHDENLNIYDVPVGSTVEPQQRMVQVAQALLASVSGEPSLSEVMDNYSKRSMLLHPVDDDDVRNWTFWPTERIGLPLRLMNVEQMSLTQELLWSLLSEKGYLKVLSVMQLENLLVWTETEDWPRGIGDYVIVFFGDPSDDEWSWRFEGHHVSLNVAVSPDGIAVTPSFLGAKPALIDTSRLSGVRLLRTWEDGAKTLINSMTDQQRDRARVAVSPGETALAESMGLGNFEGAPHDIHGSHMLRTPDAWDDWRNLPAGIPYAQLNPDQQQILERLVVSVIDLYRPQYVDDVSLNTDMLSFAFSGEATSDGLLYFRIDDGRFFYEYLNTQLSYDHVHTVWRDKSSDFGADILKRHLELHHRADQ